MGKRIGGLKRKFRHQMKKSVRQRGKLSITSYLATYEPGEKVILKAEPSYQKGMYFRRFHGKIAEVTQRRGFCYEVKLSDEGKEKRIFVHPVHMRRWA